MRGTRPASALLLGLLVAFATTTATTTAALPPYRGFDVFPTLWFGANASGLHNDTQLAFMRGFGMIGFGWQQGLNSSPPYAAQETKLAAAAAHLARSGATPFSGPVFVYRHFQAAFPMWRDEYAG